MEKNIEYMYLELENQIGNSLKVDYDDELINDLIQNDGWIEITRETNDHKVQRFIFPAEKGVIRSLNWIE